MAETEIPSEILKTETDYNNTKDEIELIDLLLVIWKWKYLITGGTAICALVALLISLIMPKIYQIETVIRPGIVGFDKEGIKQYTDTPENIMALIETGAFERRILDNLDVSKSPEIPEKLRFKVTMPKFSSTIKVSYETKNIKQGITILRLLDEYLIKEYKDLVQYFSNLVDRDIEIQKAANQEIITTKRSRETNMENIIKRINELQTEIVSIDKNSNSLNEERNKLLSKEKDEGNILSILLYSNTIQQNLRLANEYKNEITKLKLQKETELQEIGKLENKFIERSVAIESLKFKRDYIQNIQIVQEPYRSIFPIKPKKTSNVILSVFVGLFAMVFIAFLLEYRANFKTFQARFLKKVRA